MISQKQINQWKKEYGKVFRHILEGKEVYFRSMTAGEIVSMGDEIEFKDMTKIVKSCILNDVELKIAGSWITLSTFIADKSRMDDLEDLKLRAIQGRIKVKENLYLGIITKICRVFPYTPDQLLEKNLTQLLELVAMAEVSTGENIITTGDEKIKSPPPGFQQKEATTWSKKSDSEAVNATVDLSEAMAKEGKLVKTFKESKKNKHLTDLQRQMKQLSETDV